MLLLTSTSLTNLSVYLSVHLSPRSSPFHRSVKEKVQAESLRRFLRPCGHNPQPALIKATARRVQQAELYSHGGGDTQGNPWALIGEGSVGCVLADLGYTLLAMSSRDAASVVQPSIVHGCRQCNNPYRFEPHLMFRSLIEELFVISDKHSSKKSLVKRGESHSG